MKTFLNILLALPLALALLAPLASQADTISFGNESESQFVDPSLQRPRPGPGGATFNVSPYECNGAQCASTQGTADYVCRARGFYGASYWTPAWRKVTSSYCGWGGDRWTCDWNCSSCRADGAIGQVTCY